MNVLSRKDTLTGFSIRNLFSLPRDVENGNITDVSRHDKSSKLTSGVWKGGGGEGQDTVCVCVCVCTYLYIYIHVCMHV